MFIFGIEPKFGIFDPGPSFGMLDPRFGPRGWTPGQEKALAKMSPVKKMVFRKT